ncbi:hypothetical protein [Nocardioides iriomotensis]|uniref:Uncharacterized protein n=1 Tax=Nocardioides iriomotensis TaxID=715784 RepID=A0A4Q5J193_9ACTN|nr:hypothetical protein [Nocardioides iriomotensis]RYU11181.1 hypothetical protein ETU37_14170 [Nocardioides iriomotensis]
MPTSQATALREPPRTVPPWLALAAGVLPLIGFVVFLLVPYYVNDLDRLPLSEVASGLHDPKDLWPRNEPGLARFFDLGGMLTVMFGAVIAALGVFASLHGLVAEWRTSGAARKTLWIVGATSAAAMLGLGLSPVGGALYAWWLD